MTSPCLTKVVYLISALTSIYWVFVQPFIGKDFSYAETVSYCAGATGLIAVSFIANTYLIAALVDSGGSTEVDGGETMHGPSPIHYIIINMAVADIFQSSAVLSLNVYQKVTLLTSDISSLGFLQHLVHITKMSREFAFLFGIAYASGLARLCVVVLLRVRYNSQHCTHRAVFLSLNVAWVYSMLCFTVDAVYWLTDDGVWVTQHATVFVATVECFMPFGVAVLAVITSFFAERNRTFENRIAVVEEKDMTLKTLAGLLVTFFVFRAPLPILNLVKQQHLQQSSGMNSATPSHEIGKMSRIAVNLYDLKCCVNPLLLAILDTSVKTAYSELWQRLKGLGSNFNDNNNHQNNNNNSNNNDDDYEMNFDPFDQNVRIVAMHHGKKGRTCGSRHDAEDIELLP